MSAPLHAQDAVAGAETPAPPLPAWVVLVLKPIPGERVRPVTGVVVSADGLILVPLNFAARGEALIVLDGGSDIIANGRAAFVQSEHPESGLAVLSSPLLRRRPTPLSAVPLTPGTEVRLGAFPPAEQIAEGAPPLWRTIRIGTGMVTGTGAGAGPAPTEAGTEVNIAIAEGSSLPQVSGPLLDACGYLQGFHAGPVVQSLEPAPRPAITWKPGLVALLASVPLALRETPCNPAGANEAVTGEDPAVEEATESATTSAAARDESITAPAAADAAGPGATPVAAWSSRVFWLTLLGVTGAALLIWLWLRKKSAVLLPETSLIAPRERKPASETAWAGRRNQPAGPGATTSDSRLEITGKLADGTDFSASCAVNGAAFSVIVGRGKVDIVIDHASIHREHVSLSGSRHSITISDLGSASGTWINRVPCLPGEIMFVGADDTVFIGDVSFRVSVKPIPRTGGETEA